MPFFLHLTGINNKCQACAKSWIKLHNSPPSYPHNAVHGSGVPPSRNRLTGSVRPGPITSNLDNWLLKTTQVFCLSSPHCFSFPFCIYAGFLISPTVSSALCFLSSFVLLSRCHTSRWTLVILWSHFKGTCRMNLLTAPCGRLTACSLIWHYDWNLL